MNRYRSYGQRDDQPQVVGDGAFKGVDEYNGIENIAEGEVQQAINMDFTSQDAMTRGGFVCLPSTSRISNPIKFNNSFGASDSDLNSSVIYGNGFYLSLVYRVGPLRYAVSKSYDLKSFTLSSTTFAFSQYSFEYKTLIFKDGVFFIFGWDKIANVGVGFSSTDGSTWTAISTLPAYFGYGIRYAWNSFNKIVIAGSNPRSGTSYTDYYTAVSSDNGATWQLSNILFPTGGIEQILYYSGIFIGAYFDLNSYQSLTTYSSLAYSLDGLTWTQCNIPVKTGLLFTPPPRARISLGGLNFILCIFGDEVYRSYDGVNWDKTLDLPIPSDTGGVNGLTFTYFNGMFFLSLKTTYGTLKLYSTLYGENLVQRYDTGTNSFEGLTVINGLGLIPFTVGASSVVYPLMDSVSVYASTVYTDPDVPGDQWIAVVGSDSVGFYASGKSTRRVSFNGYLVAEQSTIVQCNNLVYIFRGADNTPLYWDGDWSSTFQLAPTLTPPSGFQIIPNSNQATYYQNRLWVKKGKDEILASDILDFNSYETITNSFNLNTGSSDYIVATFPFGDKTLLVFKNKSVLALNNVDGSLADVTATEVTRQVGLAGIRAITSVGPDLAYVSYKNVNLITLTATNNSVQHKTLPLSFKIKKIMDRVNWEYSYKISLGYADNKLYVALPLDNSTFCNAVAVYNFVTSQWYGEWNFGGAMNMCIQDFQVATYLGLQKMHVVTEDGRIFVLDESNTDIANQVYESQLGEYIDSPVEISTKLVTRAYDTSGLNHYQRRMFMDLATLRPKFSVVAYTEGASESSSLITDQTYTRSESWKFNDAAYDLTNANDDYNRAYRKDYSTGASSIQPQSGFEPEMLQEFRLPLMTIRQGRLSWLEITNTQGTINVMSAGFETRPGQRSNLVQV